MERFFSRPGRACVVGVGLLGTVALIAARVSGEPRPPELEPPGPLSPRVRDVALVFNVLGRGAGRAALLAAVGGLLLVGGRRRAFVAFGLVEGLTPAVSTAVKLLVNRPRPPGGLLRPSGSSFPSGHAAYAGATGVALVVLFTAPGACRPAWWRLAATAITGMAWSRVYLRVHRRSDVVAGALLGTGVSLLIFAGAGSVERQRFTLLG
jgi:undecaprenyl-diphosphatase